MVEVSDFPTFNWSTLINKATETIRSELNDGVQKGLITSEEEKVLVGTYSQMCDLFRKMILRSSKSREDLDFAAFLIFNITGVSLSVGSRNPSMFVAGQLQKELLRKRAAHSRAVKASASLSGAEVESIILACFEDRSVVKNAGSDGHKAARALEEVNRRLVEKAAELGRKPTRYKNADSLRRRYATIKERMTN